MGSNSPSAMQSGQSAPNMSILALGDERWAKREPAQRETDVAMDWPEDLLLSFNLRMAAHGMSISRTLMICDRRYAMQQLLYAQSLQDSRLQKLAARLLYHFEERQIGRTPLH